MKLSPDCPTTIFFDFINVCKLTVISAEPFWVNSWWYVRYDVLPDHHLHIGWLRPLSVVVCVHLCSMQLASLISAVALLLLSVRGKFGVEIWAECLTISRLRLLASDQLEVFSRCITKQWLSLCARGGQGRLQQRRSSTQDYRFESIGCLRKELWS